MTTFYKNIGKRQISPNDIIEVGELEKWQYCDGNQNDMPCLARIKGTGYWNKKGEHLCQDCVLKVETIKDEKTKFFEEYSTKGLKNNEIQLLWNSTKKEKPKKRRSTYVISPEIIQKRSGFLKDVHLKAKELTRVQPHITHLDAVTHFMKLMQKEKKF